MKKLRLDEDEKVIAQIRQTAFVYLLPIIFIVVLILAPFFFLFPLFSLGVTGEIIFYTILGVGLIYGFRILVRWRFNVCVVTTKKIIDMEQKGFFHRTISEIPYDKIKDIFYEVKGIMPTLFRYGNVIVAIRGSEGTTIRLDKVKNPADVQNLILSLEQMARKKERLAESPDGVSAIIDKAKTLNRTEQRALFYALKAIIEEEEEEEEERRMSADAGEKTLN